MEQLYHYLWKTGLGGKSFIDTDGNDIQVLDSGIHNMDSGPDFFNSKIKINGVEWVGNVEIHVKASDWQRHGHTGDPAYDNVILHVVGISDRRITAPDGSLIPQIELTFPEKFFRTYALLSEQNNSIRCAVLLKNLPSINHHDWLESLAVERMQQKASKVREILDTTDGDWQQTCFILLARSLGFGLNGDPFELLAKSIPLKILHHHSDNLFQLEALLFGQAALLDATNYLFDEYYQALCREYYFLARKYSLRPIRTGLWKYSRTRPQNFPHRRIAFLAESCLNGFSLFSRLLENCRDYDSLMNAFDMKAQGYWEKHYSFDTDAAHAPVELSRSSKTLLVINAGVPLIYAYASSIGDIDMGERIVNLMQDIPAENNIITRQWQSIGLEANDASRSQALIHLRKEYCDKNKCIFCRFGHQLLRKSASRNSYQRMK
ncbi:MAG: DUF2851 family protein [Muribaculaceae bacterium]|nr:DUF2851 family protein [Muribaculaceae bacterium]